MDETSTNGECGLVPLSGLSDAEVWALVDGSPDGMLLTDEFGTVLFVNSQMESLFGYDRDDLLGQPVEVLVPQRFSRLHAAHRTRYRAEPATRAMGSDLDLVARRSDGAEFPVEISLSPVRTGNGLRVVATVRDVTERLNTEADALAVSRSIGAAHDGVFMFDAETLRFSYVNHGAAHQLGYSVEELLAMTPLHIKPEFTEQGFRELLAPLVADGVESHTFTTIHRRKDGIDVPVEIILDYPPVSQQGQARLVVALVRDITLRLRNERIVRAQQVRVELLEERERVARDLHDLVIQRLFAAGMGLRGVQALASNPLLNDRITETVQQLDQTITELRSAIFQLTTKPAGVALRLHQRVTEAALGLGHEPSVDVVGDLESVAPAVLDELFPSLSEALSNIARHANATATDIAIEIGPEFVVLTVTDNGIGIDPAAPRGNGLTNFEGRAQQLGGVASVASVTNQGTTLTWSAPLTEPQ